MGSLFLFFKRPDGVIGKHWGRNLKGKQLSLSIISRWVRGAIQGVLHASSQYCLFAQKVGVHFVNGLAPTSPWPKFPKFPLPPGRPGSGLLIGAGLVAVR